MANRAHMQAIPEGPWARARWLEAQFDRVLQEIPMRDGLERLAEFEQKLFPRRNFLPLDPTCPECGQETEDGTVDRLGDVFRITYDCGHVLELTELELHERLRVDGRPA